MATQTPRQGENSTEPGGPIGVTRNMSLSGTQQERKYQLVHRNAANVATYNITQDGHVKVVCKTESSKNKKQHTIRYKYIHIKVNDGLLTIKYTPNICNQLSYQFNSACNGKPPWSTKEYVGKVYEIEHHDVVSSGTFVHKFHEKCPQEWTK